MVTHCRACQAGSGVGDRGGGGDGGGGEGRGGEGEGGGGGGSDGEGGGGEGGGGEGGEESRLASPQWLVPSAQHVLCQVGPPAS